MTMKLKKLGLSLALVVGVLTLTACGSDNKAEFIKGNEALAKLSTQNFKLKTDDLKVVADGAASAYVPIINGYLSSTKVAGKVMTEGEKSQVNLDVTLSNQKFPIEMVMKGTDAFLKLDTLQPFLEMYLQSAATDTSGIDLSAIKGKYLDLTAAAKETGEEATVPTPASNEEIKKAATKAMDGLEKTDFTKKGSAISLTLSGEKMTKLLKDYLNALPKAQRESYEDFLKDSKDFEKELSKVIKSFVITIDSQKKVANATLHFTGKQTKGMGLSGQLGFETTYSDKKVKIKMPSSDNIIKSADEISAMLTKNIAFQTPTSF